MGLLALAWLGRNFVVRYHGLIANVIRNRNPAHAIVFTDNGMLNPGFQRDRRLIAPKTATAHLKFSAISFNQ